MSRMYVANGTTHGRFKPCDHGVSPFHKCNECDPEYIEFPDKPTMTMEDIATSDMDCPGIHGGDF
jgi:hypothetical protein